MKIQIDTEKMTIRVDENIKLKDFIAEIKRLLPSWKDFEIETNTIMTWTSCYDLSNDTVTRADYPMTYTAQ